MWYKQDVLPEQVRENILIYSFSWCCIETSPKLYMLWTQPKPHPLRFLKVESKFAMRTELDFEYNYTNHNDKYTVTQVIR